MYYTLLFSLASFTSLAVAQTTTNTTRNDGIHLAISAASNCATKNINFSTVNVTSNVNAGLLALTGYTTFVTFGDSYTTVGVRDGSTPAPAVLIPPSPKAGGRTTNGKVWIEDIADDVGSPHLMDYAVGGAVTNVTLWPSKAGASDFVGQVQIFLNQKNNLDPTKTLYTVFFGINDWSAASVDGNKMPLAAQDLLNQISLLASPPTNARSFLITDDYGRGKADAKGDAYKLQIFKALGAWYKNQTYSGFKFGFVDFAPLWTAILGPTPGYAAFGYASSGYCAVNSSTTVGACSGEQPSSTFKSVSLISLQIRTTHSIGYPVIPRKKLIASWVTTLKRH
ncbi:hypothetical protein FRB95_006451 [Tulasnella sp. JGI-2019a]|nr:hypothetical protein FRB95_006451 [Tulasnella sp. JGI-2019a]